MQTGRSRSFQPCVEALEDRNLMAAQITASFAGGGLVLLLLGSVGSLAWFGRLI